MTRCWPPMVSGRCWRALPERRAPPRRAAAHAHSDPYLEADPPGKDPPAGTLALRQSAPVTGQQSYSPAATVYRLASPLLASRATARSNAVCSTRWVRSDTSGDTTARNWRGDDQTLSGWMTSSLYSASVPRATCAERAATG